MLLPKENLNKTIVLGDKARISDPCYDMDTWCAGTLENVLPGNYQCYTQRADEGECGVRIASIEVRHTDYLDVEPTEEQDIDVGVDSGQCGIYDLEYFAKAREDKDGEDKWYWRVCDATYVEDDNPDYVPFNRSKYWNDDFKAFCELQEKFGVGVMLSALSKKAKDSDDLTQDEKEFLELRESDMVETQILPWINAKHNYIKDRAISTECISRFEADALDGKCLVSSSGYGDGSYLCLVGRNNNGQIVSIKIDYFWDEEEDEE